MADILMAALSSAAYYVATIERPRSVKYHAITKRHDGTTGPACGILTHDESTEEPAYGLLESEKCGKPGCRKAFAAAQENRNE